MSETAATEPRRTAALRSPILQAGADATAFAMMAFAASVWVLNAQREEVARGFAEDWLRQQGVESSFHVTSIDAGGFVGSMRVGPRNNPVFVADRVEVAYDLTAPWAGGPFNVGVRAIRVVRPRLRVTFDGRKFSAGQLDPLINDFLARPKTKEPGPAVLIEDSLTTVVTSNGNVRVGGDAALDDGKLLRFDGRLLPTTLKGKDFNIASDGGALHLRKAGEALDADLRLDVKDLTTASLDLDGGQAAIEGTIPYPDPETQTAGGPARLRAAIAADRLRSGEADARRLAASATLNGVLAGSPANAVFTGRLNGSANVASLNAGDLSGDGLHATFASNGATLGRKATALPFTTRLNARSLSAQDYRLTGAVIDASGRFRAGDGGYQLAAEGSARGSSGLPAARARRIAAAVPVISGDPAQQRAIADFLQRFEARASRISLTAHDGDFDVALNGPVAIRSASGGEAILTPRGRFALIGGKPGGFDVAVRGGGLPQMQARVSSWSYRPGAVDARLAFNGAFNAPPAGKAIVDADGILRVRGRRTTFTLTRCGAQRAELVDFGDVDLTNASVALCPSGEPLVVADGGGGWRLRGRFEKGKAEIPIWQVAGADAAGVFDVSGDGDLDRARIELAGLRLSDTTEAPRFNPVRASGGASLANGVWQGAFPITSDDLDPVGTFHLTHNVASGAGEGRIDATGMVFAKEGLQPVEVLPVAEIIRDAEGQAQFSGVLTWGPNGVASAGTLAVPSLNFQSPAGKVTGLTTSIQFLSLAPLVTAADQTVTIERLDAITPLENIKAQFELAAEAAQVDAASATLAGGQLQVEPLTVPLAPGQTIRGVINLSRIDVGKLIADTSLADRIKVDAIVDGRLPFELGPEGLRLREGELHAVQPGRISISRTVLSNVETGATPANPMDATAPQEEFNAVQDFAYQAMENLHFEVLSARVNSLDAGRLGVIFQIKGEHDPAIAEEAKISIQEALQGTAFNRRIPLPKGTPVNLTLDTSLNFDELLAAWRRGWMDAAEP